MNAVHSTQSTGVSPSNPLALIVPAFLLQALIMGSVCPAAKSQEDLCILNYDVDNNGTVNYSDLLSFQFFYGTFVSAPEPDTCFLPITNGIQIPDGNADGWVNHIDLLGFLTEWGTSCPASSYGPCGINFSMKYKGHTYALAEIDGRCWFANNLQVSSYRNGDFIPGDVYETVWNTTEEGARAIYGEGSSPCYSGNCDQSQALASYGQLYNYFAVIDERGLCPEGWHVPTDEEWYAVTDALGGEEVAGIVLKAPECASPGWNGTNTSRFTGLPGGIRTSAGDFIYEGDFGYWWSSTAQGMNDGWRRSLSTDGDHVGIADADQRVGQSVRCIKD